MAQPTAYTPTVDFSDEELNAVGGRSTVRTAALDAELSALNTTLDQVLAVISLNQRDDGEIRDARVKVHTLAADVRAILAVGGVKAENLRGAWVTATAYVVLDLVTQSGNTYIGTAAHTSGTFATDLAAGKWIIIAVGSGVAASSVSFSSTATIAATTVQAAIDEADTENRALTLSVRTELADVSAVGDGDSMVGWAAIYDIRSGALTRHASLAAAVSSIGATRTAAVVRADTTMAANATFPATSTLKVENGAQIITTGFTLTLSGRFECGRNQCFAGSGTVVFGTGSVAEFFPEWWGAKADGSTDNAAALQACIDRCAAAGGGVVRLGVGDYQSSLPIKLPDGVRLLGSGTFGTKLTKTGSGTITVGSAANTSLVCLDTSAQGSAANVFNGAVWIDDAVRAEFIEIAYLTIRSTGSAATTANSQIGVGGVGFSEGSIHHVYFEYFSKAAVVLPVTFANEAMYSCIMHRCERGLCIEAGTSSHIHDVYARYCHSRGFYFRDMHYCKFSNLACDNLNDVALSSDYTDRAIDSRCYTLNACTNSELHCGAEQNYGTHVFIDSCVNVGVEIEGVGPASSYTGANQVALIYINSLAQNLRLKKALFRRGGVTAIQGAANAANHHDLYVSVSSQNWGFQISHFYTGNNLYDAPTAIYGNVVPSYLSLLRGSPKIVGAWTPVMNITGATGVTVNYAANRSGKFMVYEDGWMKVDFQLDVSSATYTGSPVYPELAGLPFDNAASENARLLIDQTANVTWPSTEIYWVDVLPATKLGNMRNRTDAALLTCPAAFASGATNIYFHGGGWIFVGDVFNVV